MLLKTADDKTHEIEALEALLKRADIDPRTRRQIENEIWSIRLGAKSEADAAYQLDFDLKENRRWAVIHDLRVEVEGQVAQMDHLVISRMLEVFVCESKSFTGGVKVNEHGEWTTFRDRRPVGIPSPVEQNRRHIAVLERAIKLGYVQLPRRVLAIKPTFHNRVLVSTEGSIGRPRRKLPELDSVVKVDQFRTHLLNRNFSSLSMLKLVGSDTLEAFGRQLVALHRPHQTDWAKRFGIATMESTTMAPTSTRAPGGKERKPSGIACASCGVEVSTAEAYFCRMNKPRFAGQTYCMACQRRIVPLRPI
jgi:hypothetical protein